MSVLSKGTKGVQVQNWQRMINASKVVLPVGTDGVFGTETMAATMKLQEYLGIQADGIVGNSTLTAYAQRFPDVGISVKLPASAAAPILTEIKEKKAGMAVWGLLAAAGLGIWLALSGKRRHGWN